jgi:hypothetical protein
MKMVKSLLLGSAAGLVAVAGAQAADLPVKAKPVEYVKICSIYGAGFFYIPGTDTCIKIGGWVRFEADFNAGGSHSPFYSGGGGRNNRIDTIDVTLRDRWVISNDIRTQTEYGTLRAYTRAGFDWTTPETGGGRFYVERGFIQFAGFTFGRSQSYFDFYANVMYYTGYIGGPSSTGAPGTDLLAYTATFGNGFTATIAIEDAAKRRNAVWDAGTDALTVGAMPGPSVTGNLVAGGGATSNAVGDYGAVQVPDIVGSLRVDQAWGSAQIAGALHQVRGGFYGNNTTPGGAGSSQYTGLAPADKWGYAAMAGIVINLPWAKGDQFWVEGNYSVGSTSYGGFSQAAGLFNTWQRFNGGNVATAWALDAVFGNLSAGPGLVGSGLELTTYWSAGIGIQHYWTPALRSSLFATYNAVDYNTAATAMFCSGPNTPVRTLAGVNPVAFNNVAGLAGCNPDFRLWAVGTRTIWNPVPNLDIGVEIVYAKVETNHDPATTRLSFAGAGGRAAGLYTPSNEEVWSGVFRVQRNFWP